MHVKVDVRHTFLVILVLLGLVSGVHAAAAPSPPLLALTDGALGSGSRLVALEPRTLVPRGDRGLTLPGWAFGREWARSPDGDRVALVPKPSETSERLFLIGTRGSLRVLGRLMLRGEDVCRLTWPSARRLLVVVTRGGACYTVFDSARVLVVDPLRRRVIAQHPLSARAKIVASARTREGLALLLAPPAGLDDARLVLVGATETRTIPLPRLRASADPLDKSVLGTAIGLAIDRTNSRAYIVEPQGRVLDVDLAGGTVSVHSLPIRKPAIAAKGTARPMVQALWLGHGLLAVTGVGQASGGQVVPLGLRILDTDSWRSRLVDADATGMAYAGATVLAFQPFFDRLGPATVAIGLRGYSLEGSIRFRVFSGQPIAVARVQGRYAYAAGQGPGGIVDVLDGQVELPDPDATSISPFELLIDASP
jgi:hypothetical protein